MNCDMAVEFGQWEYNNGIRRDWYAMPESESALGTDSRRMFLIHSSESDLLNPKGYAIFHTVHEFNGTRKIENLKTINCFAIDIDYRKSSEEPDELVEAKKQLGKKKICNTLQPSALVETPNGFHSYWLTSFELSRAIFTDVTKNILIPVFDGDIRASDLARVLRRPGFDHWKNGKRETKVICLNDRQYSLSSFESLRPHAAPPRLPGAPRPHGGSSKINGENQGELLMKLNGHWLVNEEVYQLKKNRDNTYQIIVNGESTSSWIDSDGLIGSYDRGGPTVIQWCKWFGNKPKKIIFELRKLGIDV